jgi:queuine tRNA-ribosyltransferase
MSHGRDGDDAPSNHEVVQTRGGAFAMRSRDAGEVMHPGVGPVVEAEQLYVRQSRLTERLRARERPTLVLFDVGLGAGSNAFAARTASERAAATDARLELVSFERDLGALRLALETPAAFAIGDEAAAAARALLEHGRHETARTSWRLETGDIGDALARETSRADIVYWDPFSPRANPALWTVAAFTAMRRCASPRATLFTYSASTASRIALLLAGWAVGAGDSIGDKAQTTAAAVNLADLARPLDRTWLTRVHRADAPLPPDAPSDAAARVAASAQFRP